MERVLAFLNDAGVFFYATTEQGKPRVRPFSFYMEHEGRLYIGMGRHKPCFKQTIENPNIEICALAKDRRWLRIKATAVLDERPELNKKAFVVMPLLEKRYGEGTGLEHACFYLRDAEAEISGFTIETERFRF
jgi:uncharacterized pyridoxamine 5'-phosphate oxidase family protein